MKWYTNVEVIDIETGEILNRKHFSTKEYRVVNKDIKRSKINENNGKIEIKWYAKRHEQYRLSL